MFDYNVKILVVQVGVGSGAYKVVEVSNMALRIYLRNFIKLRLTSNC